MRKAGLTLLLVGFAAFCWFSLFIHPAARAIIGLHYKRMSQTPGASFSREDMQREIRDCTFESLHYCRVLIVPSLMMLAGGLLLGLERRGKPY